ncbi:MAG TPA: cyclopropane-fatty-acyl-phospholipid synthase family protein [Brevundimonas sp.]|jgi:cyclopropane-fatty-acyl-phospholipid synthase|uniref:SAM-dependent methyltransferase n=1 Tax=Brevundimonas sp. TaxID=1871086 RepID=UPI002E0EE2C5|nr:cyclopropane-fatty-acyl-phospholipid synthase family protein [Brevundimonas sp.]
MPFDRLINRLQDAPAPDLVVRPAIAALVAGARGRLPRGSDLNRAFAEEMAARPIAEHVDAANGQHYELPPAFFQLCLGPRLKYSCCLYPTGRESLAEAEVAALTETCAHADLADGQEILELGCGWGSLSLWMAERYPKARITAVSNSAGQRGFIEARAAQLGLTNLTVLTRDMNVFETDQRFDRIVSVEMFEHMANWRALLTRARTWLKPDGRLFLHVFTHRTTPYRFEVSDSSDFIAQHFFTGGIMPSHDLIREYDDLFALEQDWRWSGDHYRRTADHWLENMDAAADRVGPIMSGVYGADAALWTRRWRRFYMATAGLFGDRNGDEWGVSHYRLKPR